MWNVLVDPSPERKIADFRALGMRDLIVLGRYRYARAHEVLPVHNHYDMFEINLLDEGEQPYEIEDCSCTLHGGEVLVIPPHTRHSTGSNPQHRGRLYWMVISVPRRNSPFLSLPPPDRQRITEALSAISARPFRGRNTLKTNLEAIFSAYDQPQTLFREAEIKNQALRFILDLLQDAKNQPGVQIRYAIRNALERFNLKCSRMRQTNRGHLLR